MWLPLGLIFMGLWYVQNKICFSPVNLSYVTFNNRAAKDSRKEEIKVFSPLQYENKEYFKTILLVN